RSSDLACSHTPSSRRPSIWGSAARRGMFTLLPPVTAPAPGLWPKAGRQPSSARPKTRRATTPDETPLRAGNCCMTPLCYDGPLLSALLVVKEAIIRESGPCRPGKVERNHFFCIFGAAHALARPVRTRRRGSGVVHRCPVLPARPLAVAVLVPRRPQHQHGERRQHQCQ